MTATTTTLTNSSTGMKPKVNKMYKKNNSRSKKPKMTKEERRTKYTNLARERRSKQNMKKKHANTICFRCRKRGHTAEDCPLNKKNGNGNTAASNTRSGQSICYKCGKSDHTLKACPLLTKEERQQQRLDYNKMDLPFATCYICGEKGHLASQCKLNTHGIYVNGGGQGGCKFCGANDHLYIHCPLRDKKGRANNDEQNDNDDESVGNVDEFLEEENSNVSGNVRKETNIDNKEEQKKKKKKVVKF